MMFLDKIQARIVIELFLNYSLFVVKNEINQIYKDLIHP